MYLPLLLILCQQQSTQYSHNMSYMISVIAVRVFDQYLLLTHIKSEN